MIYLSLMTSLCFLVLFHICCWPDRHKQLKRKNCMENAAPWIALFDTKIRKRVEETLIFYWYLNIF